VAVALAWAGWQFARGVALDVGVPTDEAYLDNFYERETGVPGTYRWSEAKALVRLPAVRGPAVLMLRMVGRAGGVQLAVAADGAPPATIALPPELPRRYQLLWNSGTAPLGISTLTLTGSAAPAPGDPRAVVALVESIELRSLPGVAPPPLLPLLLLGGLGALSYAILLMAGARAWALPLAALIGAALALGWGLARLWVAPYLVVATIEVAAITAVIAALRWGLRRSERQTEADLLALFAAGAALIPIYLFVDYGWRLVIDWRNLPVLLLPLGLALPLLRGRARNIAVALVLGVGAGYAAGMLLAIFSGDYASDFHAFYRSVAFQVRGTGSLYQLDQIQTNPLSATYKYPPIFALFFAPLTLLTFVPALIVWRALNLALLVGTALLLLRIYQVRLRSWAGAGLLLLLFNLRPLADTLNYGQLDILLLLLLVAGLQALERRRDLQVGVWIGVAAALKIYPIYMLGLALVRQRWRALPGAALALIVLGALSVLAFGWPLHAVFLREVLPASGGGTAWVENQTFNGFLNRLLSPQQVGLAPDGGGVVLLATYAWALGLTLLTMWLTRPAGGLRADIGYGLWIVAMLLVLPSAWMHYEALLLIPFFQAFVLARDGAGLRWPTAICYMLAWMLLAHGNLWTFFDQRLHGPFWQLVLSYKFYGMLLLYGAITLTGVRATVAENRELRTENRLDRTKNKEQRTKKLTQSV
jgi:Glycosyltransferase family 87